MMETTMAEKESNQEEFTLQESRVFPPPAEFAA
jgi:acetyl-CoA synthetase